eukprot:m51a1_g9259 hypothetical protein (1730) ;mRNA; r:56794-63009
MVLVEELEKEKSALQQEVRQLKQALKAESVERDLLEETNRSDERKIRSLEKKLADAKQELEQESQERDKLDRLNSQNERDKRSAEIRLAAMTQSAEGSAQDVARLREERLKLRQRIDELIVENEKELAGVKEQLRAEKKANRDTVYRLEEERDEARRQLVRAQQPLKREIARAEAKVADLERQLSARAMLASSSSGAGTADAQRAIETALKERSEAMSAKASAQNEAAEAKAAADKAEEELKRVAEEHRAAEAELRALRVKYEEEKDRAVVASEAAAKLEAALREAVQAKEESLHNNSEVKKLEKLLEEAEQERRTLAATVQELEESLAEQTEQAEKGEEQRGMLEEIGSELKAQVIELQEDLRSTQAQLAEALARASSAPAAQAAPAPAPAQQAAAVDAAKLEREIAARLEKAYEDKARESTQRAAKLSAELQALRESSAQSAAALERAKDALAEEKAALSDELAAMRSKEREARLANEGLEQQLASIKERLASQQKQLDDAAAEAERVRREQKDDMARRQSSMDSLDKQRSLFEKELSDLRDERKQLEERLQASERSSEALEQRLSAERDRKISEVRQNADTEIAALQKRLEDEQAQSKKLRAENAAESEALSEARAAREAEQRRTSDLQAEVTRLSAQVASLTETVAAQQKEAERIAAAKKEKRERKEKESKVKEVQSEVMKKATDEALESSKRRISDLGGVVTSLEAAKAELAGQVAEAKGRLEEATRNADQARDEASRTRQELQAAKRQLSDAEEKARTASSANVDLEARLSRTETSLKSLKSDLESARTSLDESNSNLKAAEAALSKQKTETSRLQDELAKAQSESSSRSGETQRRLSVAEEREAAAREELAALKRKLEDVEQNSDKLSISEAKAVKEASEIKAELEASRSETQSAVASHRKELDSAKKEIQQLQAQLKEAHAETSAAKTAAATAAAAAKSSPAPAAAPRSEPSSAEVDALKRELEKMRNENQNLARQLEERAAAPEPAEGGEDEATPAAKLGMAIKRAGPARRAPTGVAGARKTGAQLEGAVQLLPVGLAGEVAAKRLASAAAAAPPKVVSKLAQLKGRRRVRSWLVEVSRQSLNSNCVFVLDTSDRLYQWNGSKCNRLERSKAVDIVAKLNRARGGRAKVVVIDEGDTEPEDAFSFWKELGGKGPIGAAEIDDAQVEADHDANNKLFHVRDDGELERIEGKLVQEMLDASDCFILDCVGEIYVWIGKSSGQELRTLAVNKANELLQSTRASRPAFTEVVRCNQGGEPVLFCEKFPTWPEDVTLGPQKFASHIAASKKQEKIDVAQLYDAEPPAHGDEAEDEAGEVEVWRVVESEKVSVDKAAYGQFWSDHCYVVLHTYNLSGGISDRSYTIYFWQGIDSTKNDQGTAAALALNMSKKYRGAAQVRAPQHGEPAQFLKLFKGRAIVHRGSEERALDAARLYHVRGTEDGDTIAVEVNPAAAALNTNDAFIVAAKGKVLTWQGSHCNEFCAAATADVAKVLEGLAGAQAKALSEGSESPDFWTLLGGRGSYADANLLHAGWKAKFFVFSTRTGVVTADPAWKFAVTDLRADLMVLVDAWSSVLLWLGSKAKDKDKKVALETASDYAKLAEQREGRAQVQVLQVFEGKEPLIMTAYFHGWRPLAHGSSAAPSASASAAPAASASVSDALKEYEKTYTYAELKDKAKLPPTVDKTNLERYLSNEEFQQVFGMTKEKFASLPAWQKTPKKKDAGLF